MNTLHIVCGLPASGKTTYALKLSARLGAAFFDSDTATDLVIQAAHRAAGINPHDRDSLTYKSTYREAVYQTLFALAKQNLTHTDVVIAGPFTSELQDQDAWLAQLRQRFSEVSQTIELHVLRINEDTRKQRMIQRGALRDKAKLAP